MRNYNRTDFAFRGILLAAACFFMYVIASQMYQHEETIRIEREKHALIQQQKDDKINDLSKKVEDLTQLAASKIAFKQAAKCLASNMYFEAASEPLEGQLAVAQVTINRTHDAFRPHTICGVVHESAQFSWTLKSVQMPDKKTFSRFYDLAMGILTRRVNYDIIGNDVTYFHTVKVHPHWAKEHERVTQIGNHIFYRRNKSEI